LLNAGVHNISYEEVLNDTLESDKHNYSGEMKKVKIAEDCIFIDTTDLTALQTAQQITDRVKGE